MVLSYSFVLIRFHLLNLSPVCEYFGLHCCKQCSHEHLYRNGFESNSNNFLDSPRRRNIASDYVLMCGLLIHGLSSRILMLMLVIGENCL